MGGVGARFRAELRTRWWAWVGLAVVIGLFSGAVMAAVAGARRTDSAYGRLERDKHVADVLVEDFIPNTDAAQLQPADVAGLPSVSEADSFRSFGPLENVDFNLVASADGRAFGTGLNRPKLLRGRFADPNRADEAVADFSISDLELGQRVAVHLVTAKGGDPRNPDQNSPGVPADFRIVGIVAVPTQFPPYDPNGYYTGGSVYLTPAFFRTFARAAAAYEFSLVSVRRGQAGAFARQLDQLGKGQAADKLLVAQGREVQRSIHLQAAALWLLAGLLAVVGLLVVYQLLARQALLDSGDQATLSALGMTRNELLGLDAARALVSAAAAVVTAIGVLAVSSLFTPIGLAATAEPHPGLSVVGPVALVGAVSTTVVIFLLTLVTAYRVAQASTTSRGVSSAQSRSSVFADAAARAGLPVTLTTGVRMALERGRGRTAVPVRSTIGGALTGLAAIAAALTFGSSLTNLLHSPHLFGVTWDTEILNNNGPPAVPPAVPVLRAEPAVDAAAFIQYGINLRLDGHDLSGIDFSTLKGTFAFTVLAGRQPASDDEIMLGTKTMATLHAHIGSTLSGMAENELARPVTMRVVGRGVLPPGNAAGRLGQGAVVTRAGLLRMAGGKARAPYVIAARFRARANRRASLTSLGHDLTTVDNQFVLRDVATPTDLVNFGRIQSLPLFVGLVLALLAALTLVHLLASSIRRRRRDLAILKTLGFVRSQISRAVAWQSTTVVVVALVVGLPIGTAAGRLAWRLLASQLGIAGDVVTPVLASLLIVPSTLLLANVVALAPAAVASRTRPASVLRAE